MSEVLTYRTGDGVEVKTGDEVFSHYTFTSGTIGADAGSGWFYLVSEGHEREMLNGERICSLNHARRMGWLK